MTAAEALIGLVCLVVFVGTLLIVDGAFRSDAEYREARRRYHAPCDQCGHERRIHYDTPRTLGCAKVEGGVNCGCGIFIPGGV